MTSTGSVTFDKDYLTQVDSVTKERFPLIEPGRDEQEGRCFSTVTSTGSVTYDRVYPPQADSVTLAKDYLTQVDSITKKRFPLI